VADPDYAPKVPLVIALIVLFALWISVVWLR
jgi:hypothetical protein